MNLRGTRHREDPEINFIPLIDVLPGWAPKGGVIHAVFPSRRGLLPRVRLLIDFLAQHIRKD